MDCLGDWHFTPGWGSLITASIATLAILVSTYWNRRTLQAGDKRSQDERRERAMERKRQAVADVLAAGGTFVDALSLVRVRMEGVRVLSANDRSLIGKLHNAITDQYVPAKRDLVTKISVAQIVIVEQDLLDKLAVVLKYMEDDLIVENEFTYDGAADSLQAERQKSVQHAVSMLRAEALRIFKPLQ